jgi:hypothetical protein
MINEHTASPEENFSYEDKELLYENMKKFHDDLPRDTKYASEDYVKTFQSTFPQYIIDNVIKPEYGNRLAHIYKHNASVQTAYGVRRLVPYMAFYDKNIMHFESGLFVILTCPVYNTGPYVYLSINQGVGVNYPDIFTLQTLLHRASLLSTKVKKWISKYRFEVGRLDYWSLQPEDNMANYGKRSASSAICWTKYNCSNEYLGIIKGLDKNGILEMLNDKIKQDMLNMLEVYEIVFALWNANFQ